MVKLFVISQKNNVEKKKKKKKFKEGIDVKKETKLMKHYK